MVSRLKSSEVSGVARVDAVIPPSHAAVEIHHQFAQITPAGAADLLGHDLVYATTEFVPGGPRGFQSRASSRLLTQLHDGAVSAGRVCGDGRREVPQGDSHPAMT